MFLRRCVKFSGKMFEYHYPESDAFLTSNSGYNDLLKILYKSITAVKNRCYP
jgi:hypothetical protein